MSNDELRAQLIHEARNATHGLRQTKAQQIDLIARLADALTSGLFPERAEDKTPLGLDTVIPLDLEDGGWYGGVTIRKIVGRSERAESEAAKLRAQLVRARDAWARYDRLGGRIKDAQDLDVALDLEFERGVVSKPLDPLPWIFASPGVFGEGTQYV